MAKNNDVTKNKVNTANYWQDRATQTYLAGEKSALKVAKELKQAYNEAVKEIDQLIYSFYGKYAKETGLDLEDAIKLLNKNELKDFKSYIDKMIKMGDKQNFSDAEMKEFRRLYNKAKITRLEELETKIRGEIDKLSASTNKEVADLLEKEYEEGYYKTIYNNEIALGTNKPFSSLNKKAIEKAINTKYLSSTFSDRIWTNTSNLMNILTREIPRGLVLGYNPNKLARDVISKRIDKTLYNNTVRLIRTEYSHILNQATIDGYKQSGIASYKISTALDERTCEDCDDFEGKIVPIDEAIEGINLPPFHPNCRCTTIPYFEKDYIDEMTDKELSNIGYVTYDDWKNGLVTFKDNKVIYKGGE